VTPSKHFDYTQVRDLLVKNGFSWEGQIRDWHLNRAGAFYTLDVLITFDPMDDALWKTAGRWNDESIAAIEFLFSYLQEHHPEMVRIYEDGITEPGWDNRYFKMPVLIYSNAA
jgi:hypothetical protein